MSNASIFLESVVNGSHMVYGLRLKPLTLFHVAYLENLKNPFLTGGNYTEEELFKAAIVCSSASSKELNRKFRNIFLPFVLPFYSFNKQAENWAAYFADYMALPQFWEGNGEKSKLPFCLTCAAAAIKITGWSFQEVFFEMPLGEVLWLNQAFQYLESGKTAIRTDEDNATIAYLEALKEAA